MGHPRVPQSANPAEWSIEEVIALTGQTPEDLAANREGRLSPTQQTRYVAGGRELFGLVHTHIAPVSLLKEGRVEITEGVVEDTGVQFPSGFLKLKLGATALVWQEIGADAMAHAKEIVQRRMKLLTHWESSREKVRAYHLGAYLIAIEPAIAP